MSDRFELRNELPRHIAVIMDGNGRWATRRGLDRVEGHRRGARRVRDVVASCRRIGIRYLTLYAFSTENWMRPQAEVGSLMDLLASYMLRQVAELRERGIELSAIGDLERLPARVVRLLARAMDATRGLSGMRLNLALSYGGRDELVRAVRRLAGDLVLGSLKASAIDAETLESRLDTAGVPHPDLVIRTGGEQRLSNFLLWQAAYAELYFTNLPWPDFGPRDLNRALEWYSRRHRSFGTVNEAAV